jgi:hypothetical protein
MEQVSPFQIELSFHPQDQQTSLSGLLFASCGYWNKNDNKSTIIWMKHNWCCWFDDCESKHQRQNGTNNNVFRQASDGIVFGCSFVSDMPGKQRPQCAMPKPTIMCNKYFHFDLGNFDFLDTLYNVNYVKWALLSWVIFSLRHSSSIPNIRCPTFRSCFIVSALYELQTSRNISHQNINVGNYKKLLFKHRTTVNSFNITLVVCDLKSPRIGW